MTQLEDRLSTLVPQAAGPDDSVVAADLGRGRRALHRGRARRARRAGGALVVAGLMSAAAYAGLAPDHAPAAGLTRPGAGPTAVAPGVLPLRLVAYHGRQLPGFTVRTVPAGYVLQGTTPGVLAIARPDDHTPVDGFRDKLVVTIMPAAESPLVGSPVTVQGRPGAISTGADGTTTLAYRLGDRVVGVQSWVSLGLNRRQLVAFADGVTVTAHAVESHG